MTRLFRNRDGPNTNLTMATASKSYAQLREDEMNDYLTIADRTFSSRLILGTARYPNPETMLECLAASGTEMVTVAVRRYNLKDDSTESILGLLKSGAFHILPNTAGCY